MVVVVVEIYDVKLSKGFQFTLQAKTRRRHNLKPGQKMQVIDLGGEIILRPRKRGSLKNLVGKFRAGKKFDIVKEHDIIAAGFG